jgi:predicted dehydrogenase
VIVDKPFALTLAECDAMIAAAAKAGKLLTAFQNRRLDGDFRTVQRLIASGALAAPAKPATAAAAEAKAGTASAAPTAARAVKWVEMAYQKGGPNPARAAWKAEPVSAGGGRFLDLGAHMIDQAVTLFADQPVRSVYCRMLFEFAAHPGVDSHSVATIVFGDGSTCVLDANSTTAVEKPRFYVVGAGATFVKHGFDPQEAATFKGDIDAGTVEDAKFHGTVTFVDKTKAPVVIATDHGRWREYYENVGAVLNGKPGAELLVSLASVRRAIAVIDAALQSVRENRSIDLGDSVPALPAAPAAAPTASAAAPAK